MSSNTFSIPAEQRYFEDYQVGAVYAFGSIEVDEQEVIAFAQRFDPQVFHTEPQAAKNTVFGGLIASGWHTAGLMMRLYADHYLPGPASLGSPGVDELRWLLPVRPGDALSIRVTVLEARRSRSKPDRGIVRSLIEVLNQHGQLVLTMQAVNLMLCRTLPSGGAGQAATEL